MLEMSQRFCINIEIRMKTKMNSRREITDMRETQKVNITSLQTNVRNVRRWWEPQLRLKLYCCSCLLLPARREYGRDRCHAQQYSLRGARRVPDASRGSKTRGVRKQCVRSALKTEFESKRGTKTRSATAPDLSRLDNERTREEDSVSAVE